MKTGLFIISILGLAGASYFLAIDVLSSYDLSHIIYIVLLFIVLCNSILGIVMTYPGVFDKKRRFKIYSKYNMLNKQN